MKHVRFRDPAGSVRTGEWIDLDGTPADDDTVGTGGGRIRFADSTYEPAEVELLPPSEPSKIVCIGRNYAAHADERQADVPDRPLIFLKGPNCLASHGSDVELLPDRYLEHEAEVGVVIDRQCRHVDAADAMDVVAGFTCLDDLSNRDDQDREQNWVRGKAFDGSAPVGPVLADPEHVPEDARVTLRCNGELHQDSTMAKLIFDVPELIAEITQYLTLEPGDIIATGTPEGVGPVTDGDTVAITVEGVGTLEHTVSRP